MPTPKNAFAFREATLKDIPAMHKIRMSVKENALSNPALIKPNDYEEMLGKNGKGWVCETDSEIAGFAIADLSEKNIWALFVSPEYEGKGIGRKLYDIMIAWCLKHADKWWLSTDPDTRAEMFYEKAGWQRKGKTPGGETLFEYHKIKVRKTGSEDLPSIQEIAEKTWPVAYADVITSQQIRYMLDNMYSLPALKEQIKNGHQFLIAESGAKKVGFASFELNINGTIKTKLHKLYILPEWQGRNIGRLLTDAVAQVAREENQASIILNVNRKNKAKDFYAKIGYFNAETVDLDIGNGFYMNDYIMELKL